MARSSRKFSCRAASSRDSRRFLFFDALALHENPWRSCGVACHRGRAAPRFRTAQTRPSFSARFTPSCIPPFRPIPPMGLLACEASPASSTRPLRKGLRDALMHGVELAVHDLVGVGLGKERLHLALHRLVRKRSSASPLSGSDGQHDAPQAGRAVGRHLEAVGPFLGVRQVVAVREPPVFLEVERRWSGP